MLQRIRGLVPLQFPQVMDQSKSKKKKNNDMKCQIFLRIALDMFTLRTFPNINNIHSCSDALHVLPPLLFIQNGIFINVLTRVGLIYIGMGDARVRWLNIAC